MIRILLLARFKAAMISKGGCLWVIGDEQDLEEYIEFAEKEYGVTGGFASGKATGGRVGWYTRSNK